MVVQLEAGNLDWLQEDNQVGTLAQPQLAVGTLAQVVGTLARVVGTLAQVVGTLAQPLLVEGILPGTHQVGGNIQGAVGEGRLAVPKAEVEPEHRPEVAEGRLALQHRPEVAEDRLAHQYRQEVEEEGKPSNCS
jgi:hypothetical protein